MTNKTESKRTKCLFQKNMEVEFDLREALGENVTEKKTCYLCVTHWTGFYLG